MVQAVAQAVVVVVAGLAERALAVKVITVVMDLVLVVAVVEVKLLRDGTVVVEMVAVVAMEYKMV
jgi:hypothetical protein